MEHEPESGGFGRLKIVEHARERMAERGVTEEDVASVLASGHEAPAKAGRMAKEAVLQFSGAWLGREYPQKKVEVVYVIESGEPVVITVYASYGSWSEG